LKGKHVLITGHTGFKGSWLIAMLHHQGAKVSGIALDPVKDGIFEKAALHELLANDIRLDIRDSPELTKAFKKISPDVVIHLAAQPLVLASYEQPTETYETNVIGTLNVLKAVNETPSVEATLIITTDKVYRQEIGIDVSFMESDPLGSADPYSTSKAMADLLTQSWIASHPESTIAIARAGNVLGGGDVGENRLLPELIGAFSTGRTAAIRNPQSVRPWQHVLDCLHGYTLLARYLISSHESLGAFNFGPSEHSLLKVHEVAKLAATYWGSEAGWTVDTVKKPLESNYLSLDSSKAQSILGWHGRLTGGQAIKWTVDWYKRESKGIPVRNIVLEQISKFLDLPASYSEDTV
jgi:CDP-glucose 4,6-dehydratase